jgi:hypothetical protein
VSDGVNRLAEFNINSLNRLIHGDGCGKITKDRNLRKNSMLTRK